MECCDKNRNAFGITIGIIYMLGSVFFLLLSTVTFLKSRDEEKDEFAIIVMISSLVTAIISGVFVWAIFMKNHILIIPWLFLYIIGFFESCYSILRFTFFAANWGNPSESLLITIFLISICIIGIQIIIFWHSCCLYIEIRRMNLEKKFSDNEKLNSKSKKTMI